MKHTPTDYLFILSLYDEPIPLSKLLFHLEPDERVQRTAYLQAKADLRVLEGGNLVALSRQGEVDCAHLTKLGRSASHAAAAALADEMVKDWQCRAQRSLAPYERPA